MFHQLICMKFSYVHRKPRPTLAGDGRWRIHLHLSMIGFP